MSQINFPNNPTDNQSFVAGNGTTYQYNSATGQWKIIAGPGFEGPQGPQGPTGDTGPSAVHEVDFVASGTIPNGTTVIINTDGTVGIVTAGEPTIGSPVEFESANSAEEVTATYDPINNKVVIFYQGQFLQGISIVGTVSGNSISFGTPVVLGSNARYFSATYDSTNQKVVVAYRDSLSRGVAAVGTVSGTSISFGATTYYSIINGQPGTALENKITYDSTNGKVVIAYRDTQSGSSTQFKGLAVVGTVSGTSISFGAPVVFEGDSSTSEPGITFDPTNGKVVIVYSDSGNNYYGTARVGTVSGTSISFGTKVVFSPNEDVDSPLPIFDSTNNKVVIVYGGYNVTNYYGKAVVGTVSGTSISFGTPVQFESATIGYNDPSATYDSTNNKVVIAYSTPESGDFGGKGRVIAGTVSGTSISFGSATIFQTEDTMEVGATFDSTNGKVVIGQDINSEIEDDYGAAVVVDISTNVTSENYMGIAAESISDGATGKITTRGVVNSGQTGLTTARTYYVQNDGTVGLTTDSPLVVAGTSISSTEIIVR